MANRRIKRTKSFGSYITALNQDVTNLIARPNIKGDLATNSVSGDTLNNTVTLSSNSIQSANFLPGLTGWAIDGTGVAEFSDVYVRGDINAYSGTLGYWNISYPSVERFIGPSRLFGTFLESRDLGTTDIDEVSGTYVGLYKSYTQEAQQIDGVFRTSNIAYITVRDNDYQIGDIVAIIVNEDTSFNQLTATVINRNNDQIQVINTGTDLDITTGIKYTGTVVLVNPDISGLYLKDYTQTNFDYGYFSSEGLAYVSAAQPNIIKNASFEYAAVNTGTSSGTGSFGDPVYYVGEYYSTANYDSSSWESTLSTASLTSKSLYKSAPKFNSDSFYGAAVSWAGTAPGTTEYLKAVIDYSVAEKDYRIFSNRKVLNFNFDLFFKHNRTPVVISSATANASYVTINTSTAHGLSVGDIFYLNVEIGDTIGDYSYSSNDSSPYGAGYDYYGIVQVPRSFTVANVINTTSFYYTNPAGAVGTGINYTIDDTSTYVTQAYSQLDDSINTPLSEVYKYIQITMDAERNPFQAGESISVSNLSDARFNTLASTVAYSEGVDIYYQNPLLKSVTNKVITSNIATITLPSGHGYVAGDEVLVSGVDKAINVSTRALTSNIVTLTLASAHQMQVGDEVIVSGVGAPFDGTFTTTTGTTASTVKYAVTNANIASASATGTAKPIIFDGLFPILTAGATTFTYAVSHSNYTTTAVTSAWSVVPFSDFSTATTPLIGNVAYAYKYMWRSFSPVYDLTKMLIQYGNDTTKTSTLESVIAAVDLANWSNKRQRVLKSDVHMMSSLGQAEYPQAVPELQATNTANIQIDAGKLYDTYLSLNPTGLGNLENIRILFPAKLNAGTVSGTYSVDGSGSVTNANLVFSSGVGFYLDNVMLSTASEFFYGNSGTSEYSWDNDSTASADHVSLKAPKHWVDIDLSDQTARLEVDYVGINEKNFSKRLFSNAYISTADTSNIDYSIPTASYSINGSDVSSITMSTGEYEKLSIDGAYEYLKTSYTGYIGTAVAGFEILAKNTPISAAGVITSLSGIQKVGIEGRINTNLVSPSEMHIYADQLWIESSGTYSAYSFDNAGEFTVPNRIRITTAADASPTSTAHNFQIGLDSGQNLRMDNNEIISVNNGAVAALLINQDGGNVHLGGNGTSSGAGDVYAGGSGGNIYNIKAYTTVPSSSKAMYVGASGAIGVLSSNRESKQGIEPAIFDVAKILAIEPKTFKYKREVIEFGDEAPTKSGLIAEDLIDAGLSYFVEYNGDGSVSGISYATYVTALQYVVRDQASKIADLTSRIEALENK